MFVMVCVSFFSVTSSFQVNNYIPPQNTRCFFEINVREKKKQKRDSDCYTLVVPTTVAYTTLKGLSVKFWLL